MQLPDNIYEIANSPVKSNGRIERIYKTQKGEAIGILESLSHNEISDDDGYLDLKSSTASNSQSYDNLRLVFSENLNSDTQVSALSVKRDYHTEWNLSLNYIDKPLEASPNYLCMWNYDFYQAHKASESIDTFNGFIPLEHVGAETTDEVPFPYKFSKSQPAPSKYKVEGANKEELYNWVLVASRTKKGQEVYIYPQPVVQEKIYFKKESKAIANLVHAGTISTPDKTYNYSGEWLCTPDGIRIEEDGNTKYYVCVNTYTNADDWDNDLYN